MKKQEEIKWLSCCYGRANGVNQHSQKEKSHQCRIICNVPQEELKENATQQYENKQINYIPTQRNTFDEWAILFMEGKESEGVSIAYLAMLKLFHGYLSPIHRYAIGDINIRHIQEIIVELGPNRKDKKTECSPLAKRTLMGIKQFAQQVFRLAMAYRAIDYNPAVYVAIPQNAAYTPRTIITAEQQRWILTLEHRAKRAAMVMLYAGLRRGEATALTWDDIDLDEGFITVDKSAQFIYGQPYVKAPKTPAGTRSINIPRHLSEYLSKEKEKDNGTYYLYCQYGRMWSKTMWQQIWQSYMKDLNIAFGYPPEVRARLGIAPDKTIKKSTPGGIAMQIDTFTPHQLRHTFATNCYLAEIPVEICRDWMGHADVRTTINIYTHLNKKYKRAKQPQLDDYYSKLIQQDLF